MNEDQLCPLEGVVSLYIYSIQIVLDRITITHPLQRASLLDLKPAMLDGNRTRVDQIIAPLICTPQLSHELQGDIHKYVCELGELTPSLCRSEIQQREVRAAIKLAYMLGCTIEEIGHADMAYNLFECGYHLAIISSNPCLEVATKLLELSNPENLDQYNSAIWRFATQRLQRSLEISDQWLDAIDAVELAVTVHVHNSALQHQLCEQLLQVLKLAKDTPIAPLFAVYVIHGPQQFIDPSLRHKIICALCDKDDSELTEGEPESELAAEMLAAIALQAIIDDTRFNLMERYSGRPSLTWYQLTLKHSHLVNAVPLQKSLIVDVNRTSEFVLELIHEVTHAYCLLGPVGCAIQACRVAAQFWDAVILSDEKNHEARGIDALSTKHSPVNSLAILFDEIRLATAYRSTVLQAVWLPWLEGVAQYVELLADPTDDPSEIIAVHEAVRGLVDLADRVNDGETEEDFAERYGERLAGEFDNFVSEALRRMSCNRHLSYMIDPEKSEIYVFGYLLVRSVVARWEKTLGRRIPPIFAAKLLLDATRNGTHEIDWGLTEDLSKFSTNAQMTFRYWIECIASIDQASINCFFEGVDLDSKGHTYFWKSGRPSRVATDPDVATSILTSSVERFTTACIGLASGRGISELDERVSFHASELANTCREEIIQLFSSNIESMSLLPVGSDEARLILLNRGRVIVCPRTYVGLKEAEASESMPRYSIRSFVLAGGENEVQELRTYCGQLKKSRVLITRIIDLIGHTNSPTQRANYSYVCMFLGDKWEYITFGDSMSPVESGHSEFVTKLRNRVKHDRDAEHENARRSPTDIASTILGWNPNSKLANIVAQFDKETFAKRVAFEELTNAVDVHNKNQFRETAFGILSDRRSRIRLAEYLYHTGVGDGVTIGSGDFEGVLASTIFDPDSFSGIRPYGVTK